jgi:hypothetical protein
MSTIIASVCSFVLSRRWMALPCLAFKVPECSAVRTWCTYDRANLIYPLSPWKPYNANCPTITQSQSQSHKLVYIYGTQRRWQMLTKCRSRLALCRLIAVLHNHCDWCMQSRPCDHENKINIKKANTGRNHHEHEPWKYMVKNVYIYPSKHACMTHGKEEVQSYQQLYAYIWSTCLRKSLPSLKTPARHVPLTFGTFSIPPPTK